MMRNVSKVTPPKKTGKTDETPDRKLVQARLPFKILTPGKSTTDGDADGDGKSAKSTPGKEDVAQKRKFVEEIHSDGDHADNNETKTNSPDSKENTVVLTSKKKKKLEEKPVAVIVLDDDDDDDNDEKEVNKDVKKNEKEKNTSQRRTRNSIGNTSKNMNTSLGAASPKTPLAATPIGKRRKGAGTPKSAGGSASKVQIKIPFGGGASNSSSSKTKLAKRRKSSLKADNDTQRAADSLTESSDDIEIIADEQNPKKRLRVEGDAKPQQPEEAKKIGDDEIDDTEAMVVDEEEQDTDKDKDKENNDDDDALAADTTNESVSLSASEDNSNDDGDKDKSSSPADETDAPAPSAAKKSSVAASSAASGDRKKNLTPKQMKLMEQRRKLRDEKEHKLMDEKRQKQREKEEKELAKKREREEKEEQKRREREEKDEQRRKEREEKERKRVAEVEAKRQKTVAKEEELRKKEEERKRKELEKEEAELKKKKVAESFKKWFRPSGADNNDQSLKQCSEDDCVDVNSLAFRPFQVRADMTLAPIRRRVLSSNSREQFDMLTGGGSRESGKKTKTSLYLGELKSGKQVARKWRRVSMEPKCEDFDSDDVQIIEDELADAGQAIVEEAPAPVERVRAKFYRFHENRRPAYFGTWRKKTSLVTPRRPFAQDKKYFDYEVDSDLEWEEEEPGESLDGSDDEKEKESEDDEYEVDNEWFVPHGHLSDEELQNEDELGMDEHNDREAQKAKLKLLQQEFAQQMKKKTEKIKPRLIGCLWVDENGNQPDLCPKIIWDSLNTRAALYAEPPVLEEPEVAEKSEPSESRSRPVGLTEDMLRDLVRLVHGNVHSKIFLIKEFIASLEAKASDAVISPPLKTVREKIEEFAEWKVLDMESNQQAGVSDSSKKKKAKKRLCWVVAEDVLKRMDLQEELTLNNTWQYTLQPKLTKEAAPDTAADVSITAEPATSEAETEKKGRSKSSRKSTQEPDNAVKNTRSSDIIKFTKKLGEEEQKATAQKVSPEATTTIKKPLLQQAAKSKEATPKSTQNKKRVPLLMSVSRGEQISQPIKNALISQFLKTNGTADGKKAPKAPKTHTDEVIELD